MSEVIAGIRIPDSKLAREAIDLVREHGTPLLLAHSLRVYLFGASGAATAAGRSIMSCCISGPCSTIWA